MLAAEKTTTLAPMIPTRSMMKGGPTKANSTAVVPLTQENGLGLWKAIMAQPIRIQVVLVIEVMPKALITLIPANKGV
jgi:hypothetical protein